MPNLHLDPRIPQRRSPVQAKDAVEECLLRRTAVQDEDAAQHVEVEVVLVQIAQQPGLEEGRPSFLESQPSTEVTLRDEEGGLVHIGQQCERQGSYEVISG